ncbi:magnetic particle specific iron-binding protein [Paramagnetospirillum kuznetsovii]|uniref:Magnetic particle specific iron-binding protein n=1 Tax=Paramagnetospirillum kuznetsovii TaxID=2053833 RepID=A0A364P2Z5_9PROT|nr:magnetosome protein MamG [Paramagnetospirillum kuznetsovii]RAU23465.1 magnetic particle specific iron-binding protein [Paramagnetospirillum kuznetsovii]
MAAQVGGQILASSAVPAKASAAAGVGIGGAALGVGGGIVGSPAGTAAIGNAMLTGKGVCLGLGLGLGAWGPVLVGIAGLAGAAYLVDRLKNCKAEVNAAAEAT